MSSHWGDGRQRYRRPKGLLLCDNSQDLVCQCIKVMMQVSSLFDTFEVYTLEKQTYLC